jgi:[ribosomal protein S5]-alanine N-acetyltransferase
MIETRRLIIRPLSYNELMKHISSPQAFADELGLKPSSSLIDEQTQEAILTDLLPNLSDATKNPLFYTMWIIIEKEENAIIGGICFHGEPDINGEVEIGYGTDDEYRNRGYMTETIAGMILWARENEKIRIINAETDKDNHSSIRVLEKNGFKMTWQADSTVIMRLELICQAGGLFYDF